MRSVPAPLRKSATRLALAGALFAAIALSPGAAQTRTFTDSEGRTIKAEMADSSASSIRIRRDDGVMFEIPKARLGKADQEFVAGWETKRAFAYGGIEIAARRVRLDAKRKQTKKTIKKSESWAYKVTLKNESRAALDDLVVEWRLFHVVDDGKRKREELPLARSAGRAALGTLEAKDETEFSTTPVELKSLVLPPDGRRSDSKARTTEDQLTGIWVRLLQGNEVLAEHADPGWLKVKEAW